MLFLQIQAAPLVSADTPAHTSMWWIYIVAFTLLCALEIANLLKGREKATKEDLKEHKKEVTELLNTQAAANQAINNKHELLSGAFHRTSGQMLEAIATLKAIPAEVRADLKEMRTDAATQRERMNAKLEKLQTQLEAIKANLPKGKLS
jgi:chromosome segregation ATPase